MFSKRESRDKWLRFTRIGEPVAHSPFVPFKVPIHKGENSLLESERFSFDDVFRLYPNIGIIIDLTATSKYYHPSVLARYGCTYFKLPVQGHGAIPGDKEVASFNKIVNNFLKNNPGKLIGVHCTHGINRTGYMICQYLIATTGKKASEVINYFRVARHHPIERRNYIIALHRCNNNYYFGNTVQCPILQYGR